MKLKIIGVVLAILVTGALYFFTFYNKTDSDLNQIKNSLASFVPDGSYIFDQAEGDMNGNGLQDVVIVLAKKGTKIPSDTERLSSGSDSPFLTINVLLKNTDGTYTLSNKTNIRQTNFVQTYQDISISRNILAVEYSATRSYTIYKFGYKNNDLYLTELETEGGNINCVSKTITNYTAGRTITTTSKIDPSNLIVDCGKPQEESTFEIRPLIKFEDFGGVLIPQG